MSNDIKFTMLLDRYIDLKIEHARLLQEYQRNDAHSDYNHACWVAAVETANEITKVKEQMDRLNEEKYGEESQSCRVKT